MRDDELAYVVHELRSPLTAIDGFAHLAAAEVSRMEQAGDLPEHPERIRHGVRTLQGVIEALHDTSAANLGGMALDLRPTEMNDFAQATVEAIAPARGARPSRSTGGHPSTPRSTRCGSGRCCATC